MIEENLSHQNNKDDYTAKFGSIEKLFSAYQQLELALKSSNLGFYELDLESGMINCSAQCKANYGLAPDGILNRPEVFNAILPEYHDYIEAQLNHAFLNHTEYQAEYEVYWPDKSIHWIKATGFATYNEANQPVKLVGITVDISAVKKAEEEQAMLAAIIDSSDDTILSKTLEGIITSWNKAAERMFGYNQKEAVGKHISLLIPPERLHEEEIIIANISQGLKVDHFETERVRKDGTIVPISLSVSPIKNSKGKIIGASKIARDISVQKMAHEKQATLAAIVDTSDDTIISKTIKGYITSWNKAAEKMFGYTEQEVLGKHISIIIPEDRWKEEEEIINRVSKGELIDHFETIRLTKDGEKVPISLSVSPIYDEKGNIIGCSKIARNLTDKKVADEKQAILAAIVDTSDDAIVSKTLQGIVTSWNRGAEQLFGYSETEAVGRHISLIIPKNRLNEEDHIIGNVSAGKRVNHFETYRLNKEGKEIPVSLSVSPITDSRGQIIGASKIARDISQQIQSKELLQRHNERLQIINSIGKTISEKLDLTTILQGVTDATTKLTGANFGAFFYNTISAQGEALMLYTLSGAPREAFEQFGMPRNTAVFHTTFSGEGISRVDDITKDARYGKNAPHHGMPKGHLPVVSYLAVPVISNSGTVIGGLFFGHQEAAVFTQEHEDLVAGVASQAAIAIDNAKLYEEVKSLNLKKDEFIGLASHELKTPLTSINGYLQILERNQTTDINKNFVKKTVEQVKKLTGLVSDLLDVSKIEAGKLQFNNQKFALKELINDIVELMHHTSNQHTISFEASPNDVIICADRQRIEQVFINLLTNAMKYSPKADKVVLTLRDLDQEVEISIQDFGLGIPNEKLEHIFSRFYRVDELSPNISGLGIGLYITKEIIQRHNGKLNVKSELSKGSIFTVTLPKGTDCF